MTLLLSKLLSNVVMIFPKLNIPKSRRRNLFLVSRPLVSVFLSMAKMSQVRKVQRLFNPHVTDCIQLNK